MVQLACEKVQWHGLSTSNSVGPFSYKTLGPEILCMCRNGETIHNALMGTHANKC